MKDSITISLYLLLISMASCREKEKNYDASGSFEATETIISAEANGKILQLAIEEGQQLEPGKIVGYIDSSQLYLNKAQLAQNKKAILSGRPQTNLQVEALKKELANAVFERNRTANLVNGGVASQKQLDDANSKIAVIQAKIKAQESTLATSTTTMNEQGGTVDAQLNALNDQLKKYTIINPVAGVVLTKYAEQYEVAVTGKPLYKIGDLSSLILRAYVTGDQLPKIKIGQTVKVNIDNGSEKFKEYKGNIEWISEKAEFTPKTIQTIDERANLVYAVKIGVKNDGYLKIGMYGEVKF